MFERFREMANKQPRAYGATVFALGVACVAFAYGLREMGRMSFAIVVIAPAAIVFGLQMMVLGTTLDGIRSDRATAGVLVALSVIGGVLLFGWLVR